MYTVAVTMNPPAANATPPITSNPTQTPHGFASVRFVLAPNPNRKRAAATEAAKPTSVQSASFSLRSLFMRFVLPRCVLLNPHAALDDPRQSCHAGHDTRKCEWDGFHRNRGGGWQRLGANHVA